MRYLLDTNPIIDAIKAGIRLLEEEYLVSFVTELELLSYSKLSKKEEQSINALLSNFLIVNVNEEIKKKTIELRKRYRLKLPDSIIVATAIIENAVLVTADRQLKKIKELEITELDKIVRKEFVDKEDKSTTTSKRGGL